MMNIEINKSNNEDNKISLDSVEDIELDFNLDEDEKSSNDELTKAEKEQLSHTQQNER